MSFSATSSTTSSSNPGTPPMQACTFSKPTSAGRATFLVHPNDAQANFAFAEGMQSAAQTSIEGIEGVVPLKECVRVLDDSGDPLKSSCRSFARASSHRTPTRHARWRFPILRRSSLSPSGETFHNVTVTAAALARRAPWPSSASSPRFSRR